MTCHGAQLVSPHMSRLITESHSAADENTKLITSGFGTTTEAYKST